MTDPIRTSSPAPRHDPVGPPPAQEPSPAPEPAARTTTTTEPISWLSSPSDALSTAARQLVDRYTSSTSSAVTTETPEHPARWYYDKIKCEAACLLPCSLALKAAEREMPEGGVARKTMDHFLSGAATPMRVDVDFEVNRNPQLREYVTSRVESEIAERARSGESVPEMNGAVWVPQSAYGQTTAGRDQQLSLGGTYFEYQVSGSAPGGGLEVTLNVADHYFWSPSESTRPTQCLHECGDALVSSHRATEFYQTGEGTIVVNDPSENPPMTPLEVQETDDG